jgi:predicted permease
LGAGRARLVRQFLTESVTLSCAGAAIGAAFAVWASTLASKFLPLSFDPRPDTHVLFYLAALAISTGILFGSAPAIRGTDLQANEALKLGRIGSSGARWSFGKALLAFQVALSVALLLGAFLFIGTLKNLRTQHTGFDGQNLMFITMNTERSGMNGQQMARFYDGLLADIRALPSVRSGSLVAVLPLSGAYVTEELDQEQWPNLSKPQRIIYVNRVGSDFFKTAGMHLLAGRSFDESDSAGQEKLAVLNAAAARTYFPTGNAIGRRLVVDSKSAFRIIGVVENAKYAALRDPAPRTMFLPATQAQNMSPTAMMAGTEWHLLVRADSASGIIGNAVRRFVRASGKDVVVEDALPFDQLLDSSLVTERILAVLAAFFAALAAVLVGIGLYGVLGYTVSRRTSEIGIRMALGAASRDVLWLVLRDAVTVAATGIILGAVIAIACGRFVSSLLFEARPNDPVTLIAAAVFTLALAAIAGYLPARRASRLDPMTALRWE